MIKYIQHLIIALLISAPVFAGVVVVTESKSMGCQKEVTDGTSTVYLRPDIMRIDMKDEKSSIGMIYKKSEGKIWILDYDKKEFYTITKEELEEINAEVNEMMQKLEEQLQALPEGQREQVREMMKKQAGAAFNEPPEVKVEKQSETKNVGEWSTTRYNYLENGDLKQIHWVTDQDKLGVEVSDLQIMFDMSNFIKDNMDFFSFGGSQSAFAPGKNYDGFPVFTEYVQEGKVCMTSTVKSVTSKDLDNSLFQIPDGYKKHENPKKKKR